MPNKNVIDEINTKVSEILQHSPAKDIEKNMKILLSGALSRLDLVMRDEFDVQQEVLQRTREKMILLEARVSELEAQLKQTINQPAEQDAAPPHTAEELPAKEVNLNQC